MKGRGAIPVEVTKNSDGTNKKWREILHYRKMIVAARRFAVGRVLAYILIMSSENVWEMTEKRPWKLVFPSVCLFQGFEDHSAAGISQKVENKYFELRIRGCQL